MSNHSKNDTPRLVHQANRFAKGDIDIVQKTYNARTWYHWHDYFEFEFFLHGTGNYQVNGINYPLERGSCYMVTPADFHSMISSSEMIIVNFAFNDRVLSKDTYDRIYANNQWPVVRFSEEELSFIEPILDKLSALDRCLDDQFPLRERAIASLLEFLVILYMQKIETKDSSDSNISKIVLQAVSYIKYNFKSKLTLQEVAATIPITPNYLGARFREQMGMSFNSYLMQARLSYAHNLLKSDNFSVEEVASASGFSTPSYFSDCFRKHYGYSPMDMKKILSASQKGLTVRNPNNFSTASEKT